jgi:hypothetical protein
MPAGMLSSPITATTTLIVSTLMLAPCNLTLSYVSQSHELPAFLARQEKYRPEREKGPNEFAMKQRTGHLLYLRVPLFGTS